MAMRIDTLTQERLALVVCSAASGVQLRKIPVYAEILLTEATAARPPIRSEQFDNLRRQNPELAARAQEELQRCVDGAWLDAHRDPLLQRVLAELEGQGFDTSKRGDTAMLDAVAGAVEAAAQRAGAPAPQPRAGAAFDGRRVPLGVLATDHCGYLSYDLTRLNWDAIIAREQWPECNLEFRAYPLLLELHQVVVLDQRRYANDAIFAKIEIAIGDGDSPPEMALNLPAMQNPSLIDWRLSPGSFAAVPQQLIGADGCETLTPANFAVSEFHMRQVVRLNELAGRSTNPRAHVYEYGLTITPIGHSLGEVKYALPLAPGETVRLAVVDWRRTDTAARTETTVVTESLLHDQTHDRMITETVRGALEEWQRGGSVMGGLAGGAGASGQSGSTSIVGGGMLSLGGAYATSSGSRNVAVDSTQKITEAVHQASVGQRELNSTVVVQSDQLERQNIETRAFANNNRGHTLTVLYYEVLRHFRVETRYRRRYDAVLLQRDAYDLRNDVFLLAKRQVLAPALLNPALSVAFDALERIDRMRKERARNPPVTVIPFDEANLVFNQFEIRFRVGTENSTEEVNFFIVANGAEYLFPFAGGINANFNEDFNKENANTTLMSGTVSIRWGDIQKIVFRKGKNGGQELRVVQMDIIGHSNLGSRQIYYHVPGVTYTVIEGYDSIELAPVVRPPSPPPPQPASTFEQSLPLDDYAVSERLKDHLTEESEYYWRILDLSQNANRWARRLEDEIWEGTPTPKRAIDVVAPTPLEVLGSRIAFPMLVQGDEAPADIPPVERLISLPTRGVFAEAKLGHCNVAEEIDDTRFWRWDEHPLPFMASDIAAVQPIQPTPQQQNLAPTPFPAPIATIQSPAALPQPTAMSDALKLLMTPGIFRDMSGSQEVKDLLGNLINGSVSMAEAATKAQDIQAKLDKQQRDEATSLAQTQAGLAKALIEGERAKAQQVTPAEAQHAISLAENQAAKGNIDKATSKQVATNQVTNMKGSQPASPPTIEVQFYFKQGASKQILDGNFDFIIDGPSMELGSITTSMGAAKFTIPKWPAGEYGITIQGSRTKLPELAGATVQVPAIGNREPFDLTLNRYVELKGIRLNGNGKLKLEPGTSRVVVMILATETSSNVTREIDYSREQGVDLQAEASFGAEIGKFEIGTKIGGTSIDVGTNGNKYVITLSFTYLTGGLEMS